MKEVLYATGMFEIGDTFEDDQGNLHTITDVLICHYMRRGSYRVLYEVDGAGEFTDLKLRGFGNLEDIAKQTMQQHRGYKQQSAPQRNTRLRLANMQPNNPQK